VIRVKNLRILTIAVVAALVVWANIGAMGDTGQPFATGNTVFDVKKYVGDSDWIENAPIVLGRNFKHVTLINIKSDVKGVTEQQKSSVQGFSVQKEIVDIFGGVDANYSEFPLDFRNTTTGLTLENLKPYQFQLPWEKTEAEVHCVPAVAADCTLALFWNKATVRRNQDATFIGVRLRGNFFGLVEEHLFEQLGAVRPHA